jgi:NADPH-dependent 7-cyano-7-deazaguanine reductase QueF
MGVRWTKMASLDTYFRCPILNPPDWIHVTLKYSTIYDQWHIKYLTP